MKTNISGRVVSSRRVSRLKCSPNHNSELRLFICRLCNSCCEAIQEVSLSLTSGFPFCYCFRPQSCYSLLTTTPMKRVNTNSWCSPCWLRTTWLTWKELWVPLKYDLGLYSLYHNRHWMQGNFFLKLCDCWPWVYLAELHCSHLCLLESYTTSICDCTVCLSVQELVWNIRTKP